MLSNADEMMQLVPSKKALANVIALIFLKSDSTVLLKSLHSVTPF